MSTPLSNFKRYQSWNEIRALWILNSNNKNIYNSINYKCKIKIELPRKKTVQDAQAYCTLPFRYVNVVNHTISKYVPRMQKNVSTKITVKQIIVHYINTWEQGTKQSFCLKPSRMQFLFISISLSMKLLLSIKSVTIDIQDSKWLNSTICFKTSVKIIR